MPPGKINTEDRIPFALPFTGKEEEEAVLRVLRSGWLTTGSETFAFEREFAAFLGGSPPPDGADGAEVAGIDGELEAAAVNSATSGLHLALEAAGTGAGDIVLVPSYTFAASAEAALYTGAEVAFIDVKKDSFLIDPDKAGEVIIRLNRGESAYKNADVRGRPAAIIPVHFAGLPCDMEAIMRISRKYGVPVVEDAAHSFPSKFGAGAFAGEMAGTIGRAGVFSFYATKPLATGEGGMVVTRDRETAERIRISRLHGIDRPVWDRYKNRNASWYYEVVRKGYKYNMPDLLAAIGRVQLKRAGTLLARRREIAALYDAAFAERFIIPPTGSADARYLYPLRLKPGFPLSRNDFAKSLQEKGVGVSVHFIPLHTMPLYRERYNLKAEDYPETMKSFAGEISLPLYPGLTDVQVQRVIDAVNGTADGAL